MTPARYHILVSMFDVPLIYQFYLHIYVTMCLFDVDVALDV
jgi:hypothetical protein